MHPMTEMKEQLKDQARSIRSLKLTRKSDPGANWKIYSAARKYRHEHIAYCLVRGRSYEQIEKPGEFNKPNWDIINQVKDRLQKKVDEANALWAAEHPPMEVANG
jgi:hypothetical protein